LLASAVTVSNTTTRSLRYGGELGDVVVDGDFLCREAVSHLRPQRVDLITILPHELLNEQLRVQLHGTVKLLVTSIVL
jgi:hypothetical protein